MKFRIYYGDGSTYSGDPYDAPRTNVQAVVNEESSSPTGFAVRTNGQVYVWRDERWFDCDQFGMWDYLMLSTGPKAVLFGRTMRNDEYWATVAKAQKEGLG